MGSVSVSDREELSAVLETLQAGDCLVCDDLTALAAGPRELLRIAEELRRRQADLRCAEAGIDTAAPGGELFFRICSALSRLDRADLARRRREGIEQAREEGRYRGRRPIEIDEPLFDAVVARWKQGEITAREAMSRLQLKPNTFYRRIKEREESKMKEVNQVKKEIREEILESTRQGKKAVEDLREQVRAEARELKKAADDRLDAREAEFELRRDRVIAEIEHKGELRQMKKDVESEAAELKKLLAESDKQ